LAPYIANSIGPPTHSWGFIVLTILISAVLIFIGHILTRILWPATDETEFWR